MKKTNQYISLLLAVLMTVGLSSCIKEDYAVSSDETATVNLMFTTRADLNQDGVDEDARIHEGIKTLRVILVQNGKVIVNHKAEGLDKGDAPVLSQTITFWQIPKAQSTFYAVANEESVEGLGNKLAAYTPESAFNTSDDQELRGEIITVQTGTIPGAADDIATNGLPIAGIYSEDLSNVEDGHTLRIPITRAVAKFVLYINNESGEAFNLNSVNLGTFVADRTYLFPVQNGLPQGVTYNEEMYSLDANTTVAADDDGKGEPAFIGYIYETGTRDAGDFTLSLTSDTPGFEDLAKAVPIQFNQQGRNHISRNEQVEITATVDVNKEVQTDLKILVVHWGKKVIEVPSFN